MKLYKYRRLQCISLLPLFKKYRTISQFPTTFTKISRENDTFTPLFSINEINMRIKNEICYNTIHQISDPVLLPQYKESISVKKKINNLNNILKNHIDDTTREHIIDKYLGELIPAGTKGVIRGNHFNQIVKQRILNMNLDYSLFEIGFEKKCIYHFTNEIPDWYITEKSTNKTIIGMNQLDLWRGGQQLNRGFKYIDYNIHNNSNIKLLCVICNEIQFTNKKTKVFKLFQMGFSNNTLCYLNNLQNIIYEYFMI